MKSLYFVGNEELWRDAWFTALLESLKSHAVEPICLSPSKDAAKIIEAFRSLGSMDRVIFHKGLNPSVLLRHWKIEESKDLLSRLYVFSEIMNASAVPKQLSWGISADDLLKNIGFWEGSQIVDEAFLMDLNVAQEISKVMEKNTDTVMDEELLTANADDISQLIRLDESLIREVGSTQSKTQNPELLKKEDKTQLDPRKTAIVPIQDAPREANFSFQKLKDSTEADFRTKLGQKASPNPEFKEGEASDEVSHLISAMSQGASTDDLEVFKKYASLKERELREAQSSLEALKRQVKYLDERLKKSEGERRKLQVKIEETENELRTIADKKDESKAHLKSAESRYEERIKELQIQLESAQFKTEKLDKKLLDFRERVRNDLQKIRSRERELASRLEIQKRDAEALLCAKDERLLNQKREIDRLEFELDALKERMLDDAAKGEERRKRVSRAIQSLKLAQSILSGLEEDHSHKDEKDEKDNAA